MEELDSSSDEVVMKLVEMGFAKLDALEAVKAVGKSCGDAVEYLLKRTGGFSSASSLCSAKNNSNKTLGKRALPSSFASGSMRQSSLFDHFRSVDKNKRKCVSFGTAVVSDPSEETIKSPPLVFIESSGCSEGSSTWEKRVNSILRNRFGISSLKSFQREALSTWVAHKDCLVLAATGSGKSLCFQIPALLTGKVVVVISPLISPNLFFFISRIREQSKKFMEIDRLWWKGLARIMEAEGYIKEMDNKSRRVEIAFIEPTEKGKRQLDIEDEKPLYVYPEADMLVSLRQRRTYSGFSSWGKGWADPEIRRQRLETMKRPRERKPRRERSRQQQRPLKLQKNVPWKSKE